MGSRTEKPSHTTPERAISTSARTVWTCLAVLACLGLMTHLVWRQFGPRIQAARAGYIREESIEIPPLPRWIRSDVRAEAVRQGSLTQYSIAHVDLTWRVAEAFQMHSWVARVRRAYKKPPSRVIVDLVYRKPVAMVEVADPSGTRGLFPVDAFGYFLPPQDFMPAAQPVVPITDFPRLRADHTYPAGVPGTPWGDVRIHQGAVVADYLQRHWKRLGLYEIVGVRGRREGVDPGTPTFEVRTAKQTVVLWGHAPGEEVNGEATADKKLALLADFFQQHGTLDAVQSDQTIDVRHISGLEVATVGRQLR